MSYVIMIDFSRAWRINGFRAGKYIIWMSLLLCPLLLAPAVVSYIVFGDDFASQSAELVVLSVIISCVGVCLLMCYLSSFVYARWLARAVKIENDEIIVGCYFQRDFALKREDVLYLEQLPKKFFNKYMAFLSKNDANYALATKCGQKFYLSGKIHRLESLIQVLSGFSEVDIELENPVLKKSSNDVFWESSSESINFFSIALCPLLIVVAINSSYEIVSVERFQGEFGENARRHIWDACYMFGTIWLAGLAILTLARANNIANKVRICPSEITIWGVWFKEYNLKVDDIESIRKLPVIFCFTNIAFLPVQYDMYLLETSSGQKIYFSSPSENIEPLLVELNSVLNSNSIERLKTDGSAYYNETWGALGSSVGYSIILIMLVMLGAFFYVLPRFLIVAFEGRLGDFLGTYGADVFFAVSSLYVFTKLVSSLFNSTKIIKKIKLDADEISIWTLYFKYRIKLDEVESFERLVWRWYYTDITFLRKLEDNFVLNTRYGRKFYLIAEPGTIGDLVERLNGFTSRSSD